MSWTAPRTWVALELVTAAIMNQHVRDELLALASGNAGAYTLPGPIDPIANTTDIVAVTLTTHGGPVVMLRAGGTLGNASGITQSPVFLTPYVDGVAAGASCPVVPNEDSSIPDSTSVYCLPGVAIVVVAAGSHTFAWRDNIGDGSPSWAYSTGMTGYVAEVGF